MTLIRRMKPEDCRVMTEAFAKQGWKKPLRQFQDYVIGQATGRREVLIAESEGEFAGYLTVLRQSKYPPFGEKNIPEINDFNVLIKFRRKGIGTTLMDAAENLAAEKAETIGIGVGLTPDYGAAQRLYVKRGYVPDGRGIFQREIFLKYGDRIIVDDDLTLWLTKQLGNQNKNLRL